MSFGNTDFMGNLAGWLRPLIGKDPFNKKSVETAMQKTNEAVKVFEDHFMINTYLVGERIMLADFVCASFASRAFSSLFDKKWRADYPNFTRWYETIINQPVFKSVISDLKLCDEALKIQPPAKEQAPKKETKKEAPKPKTKEPEDEEDEPAPAPKPKHPLEALGRPSLPIDDVKRKYKNEETREVALPWLWENVNFEEYSIWQVGYKYNDELTLTFMSSNLIGEYSRV